MNPVGYDWKRKLLITGAATLALLLAGETTLRLWDYYFRTSYRRFDIHLGMVRPVPGYQETLNGRVFRINSLGFRAAEFTKEKPPGVFRIIMLGDSVTFGLPFDECHYPGVLQQLFDAEGQGRVEVINSALEGYDSRDVLRLLERELMGYSPDLVTVLIGWNDLIKRDPASPAVSDFQTQLSYAMYDVYLVRFWRKVVYFYLRHALLQPTTQLSPEEEEQMRRYIPLVYKENLQRIISTARTGGSDVVLFTLPSLLHPDMGPEDVRKLYFPHFTYNLRKFILLYEQFNKTIRDVGRLTGVQVIETQEPLRGYASQRFMDTAHPDCEGHRILGEYLHGVLSELVHRKRSGANVSRR